MILKITEGQEVSFEEHLPFSLDKFLRPWEKEVSQVQLKQFESRLKVDITSLHESLKTRFLIHYFTMTN